MNTTFQRAIDLFIKFPGIGSRQARRFAYFILSQDAAYVDELISTLSNLRNSSRQCARCYRFFTTTTSGDLCDLCVDTARDGSVLMVVEKDLDLENIRKLGSFKGQYFVLGGLLPILEARPETVIRAKQLLARITDSPVPIKEVILALSANPEGDNTAEYLQARLNPLREKGLQVTMLGRGLSTGTELEYSDKDTLDNALRNRR